MLAKFDACKPRDEKPSSLEGGKVAYVDRVEWRIIPEAATAAAALQAGEIDWLEMPLTDLLPMLKQDKRVVVGQFDPYGLYPVLRFNQLQGPTTNEGVRRAILATINSREVMQAIMADDTASYHAPVGAFLPRTPYANTAGMDLLGPQPADEVKAMLTSAGYNGEKLVVMHRTDQPFYDAMIQVVVAQMKGVGLNIDDQALDWGTVVQRRGTKDALAAGGWSMFCTSFPALYYTDPLSAPGLRGIGQKALYGWPTDPLVEQYRQQFIDATYDAARRTPASGSSAKPSPPPCTSPPGQYFQSAAWLPRLSGQLKAQPPLFWNVKKS